MRIHPVVNISRVVRYRELVKRQNVEELKPVEVNRVEEWEVEKILNKRKVRRVMKYLVYWKGFIVENNTCEKEEDLENIKERIAEFKRRMNTEVRQQEKLDMAEDRDFRRGELSGKYIVKMLYRYNDNKFERVCI